MATKRKTILTAMTELLKNATDAQDRVYRGRLRFSAEADTFPLISLLAGDSDILRRNAKSLQMSLPVSFLVVFQARLDNPGDVAEDLFGQVKTVLFAESIEGSPNGQTHYAGERAKLIPAGESGIAQDDIDDFMLAEVRGTLEYYETVGNP